MVLLVLVVMVVIILTLILLKRRMAMKGMKMTGMAGVADFSNPNYETRKNYYNNIVILANSIATLLNCAELQCMSDSMLCL